MKQIISASTNTSVSTNLQSEPALLNHHCRQLNQWGCFAREPETGSAVVGSAVSHSMSLIYKIYTRRIIIRNWEITLDANEKNLMCWATSGSFELDDVYWQPCGYRVLLIWCPRWHFDIFQNSARKKKKVVPPWHRFGKGFHVCVGARVLESSCGKKITMGGSVRVRELPGKNK